MNLLVALKPLSHNNKKESYASLLEVDFKGKKVLRVLRIPASSYTSSCGYMRNHLQGISIFEGIAYLSMWNYIVLVDLGSFQIIDSFSHPMMSDLHGIDVSNDEILVCSTGVDTLLCFDRRKQELKWHWRPDESPLSSKLSLVWPFSLALEKYRFLPRFLNKVGLGRRLHERLMTRISLDREYRGRDKTRSALHAHHLNEVKRLVDDKILVLTKGWNDSVSSTLIELNSLDMTPQFLVPPSGFSGAHDIVVVDNSIYVTQSANESIGVFSPNSLSGVKHFYLGKSGYFVRGLLFKDDSFIVGFTPSRNSEDKMGRQPVLRRYSSDFSEILDEMILEGVYSDDVGGAVHTVDIIA